MINIEQIMNEPNPNVQSSIIDFHCDNCKCLLSENSLNLAVFLYGFFYLKNSNTSYIGITCPSCINTILIKENNSTSTLFERFASEFGLIDINVTFPKLTYFTSIYHLDSFYRHGLNLQNFNSSYYETILHGENESIDDEVNACQTDNNFDKHLCSFAGKKHSNLGIRLLAMFIDENNLENLVRYEQEQNIRIIPRYFHRLDLLDKIELLCDKYRLESPLQERLRHETTDLEELNQISKGIGLDVNDIVDANPEILTPDKMNKILEGESKITDILFGMASDFMDILAADPYPWDIPYEHDDWIKKIWKQPHPFRSKEIQIDLDILKASYNPSGENANAHKKKVAEIQSVFSKWYIQKLLSKQCAEFICDYSQIAMKYALSYADVWRLKEQHFEIIYQAIRKDPDDKYKQACREIASKLWANDEKLTIKQITENAEIKKIQKKVNYNDDTMGNWIKDLNPDNSPGRPKKK